MWNKYTRALLAGGANIMWFRSLSEESAKSTDSGLNNGQLRALRERGILKKVSSFSSGGGCDWTTGPNYKSFMKVMEKQYEVRRRQVR